MVCCAVLSYRELRLTAICGVLSAALVLGYHVPLLIDEQSPVSILSHNIMMMLVAAVAAALYVALALGACCHNRCIVVLWLALTPVAVAVGIAAVVLKITGHKGVFNKWFDVADLAADCVYLLTMTVTWVGLVISKRRYRDKGHCGSRHHSE